MIHAIRLGGRKRVPLTVHRTYNNLGIFTLRAVSYESRTESMYIVPLVYD